MILNKWGAVLRQLYKVDLSQGSWVTLLNAYRGPRALRIVPCNSPRFVYCVFWIFERSYFTRATLFVFDASDVRKLYPLDHVI